MTWNPVNLAAPEFARRSEPPKTLALLYDGKRYAVSGPPESAKSLIMLIAGLEHKRAGRGRFAFVDFENDEATTRLMLAELGATDEEIASVYYVAPDGPPTDDDVAAIIAAGVTFVIVDAAAGAYDASRLDDNKRADVERFAREWVKPFWRHKITTVLIDHVVKSTDGRGRFAIGSERKLGAVDVHLGLEPVRQLYRGGSGLVRVATHKDRPGHLRRPYALEIELESDPETHAITWQLRATRPATAGNGWLPTVIMEKVSRFLEPQIERVPRSTIEQARLGRRLEDVRTAIDALVAHGYADEEPGAHGARLTGHLRPFRVDEFLEASSSSSSDLVPARPDEVTSSSSSSSVPYKGDEQRDEDEDEQASLSSSELSLYPAGDDDIPF